MLSKQGELRVQKGGVIYGPMMREALDRLLVDGKIARSDLVSVRGGDWMEITAFLLQPAAYKEDATLRLLAGAKVYSSLSRRQIEQLRSGGRADDDDLICALNGPWMRVGDFFGSASESLFSSRTSVPDAVLLSDGLPDEPPLPTRPQAAASATSTPAAPLAPAAVASAPGLVAGAHDPPAAGKTAVHAAQPDSDAVLRPLPVLTGHGIGYKSPPPELPSGVWLSEIWFVRVRGMHSAPLKKRHVKRLFEARELTADSPARNASWPDDAWSPIYLIPELADIAK